MEPGAPTGTDDAAAGVSHAAVSVDDVVDSGLLAADDPDGAPSRRRSDVANSRSKRTLQALSRRIEALAVDSATAGPITLVGLFQLPEYFHDSRDDYERLAAHEDTTVVVGYVGTRESDTNVDVLELAPDSALAEFWTVLLLTPRGCAGLRARDTGQLGLGLSVEASRLFDTRSSTEPATVRAWLEELLEHGTTAMDEHARQQLRRAADEAGTASDHGDTVAARALQDAWDAMSARIEALQRTELLMFTDPLTGARNRRFLDGYLARLGGRAPDIAVAAFDFDDFKSINDTHGHAVGDEALRTFAEVTTDNVRDTDVLVRSGGDEWVLLLPGMELPQARERVARVIAEVADRGLSVPGVHVRASAGLGVFPASAVDLDAVDEALYAAKEADQRIVVVGDTPAA